MGAGAAPTVMGGPRAWGGVFINGKHQVVISQGRLCGGSLSAPFAAALGALGCQRSRGWGRGRHALFSRWGVFSSWETQ